MIRYEPKDRVRPEPKDRVRSVPGDRIEVQGVVHDPADRADMKKQEHI